MTQAPHKTPAQPVWPATIAVLAVGGLHLALPEPLTFGPSWLLLAVVTVILIPVYVARMRGSYELNQKLGYVLLWVVSAAMLWSVWLLVSSLPRHTLTPLALLRSAGALWITNVLVFASWYWRLDAGGPHARKFERLPHQGRLSLSPDDARSRLAKAPGSGLVSRVRGLSFPRLQHQHCFLAHRLSSPFALGQSRDDGAIKHFARHLSPTGSARRQHPVIVENHSRKKESK
jgi:hypothetical protein